MGDSCQPTLEPPNLEWGTLPKVYQSVVRLRNKYAAQCVDTTINPIDQAKRRRQRVHDGPGRVGGEEGWVAERGCAPPMSPRTDRVPIGNDP